MKSINTKRIAAVAASLLMGLAFAGSGGVTWSNIPIINNQGQPVVQVVVGSTAQPSDGVVAANIAAVLGNLAFTTQNVTAQATGLNKVNCVVTTPSCTLTNQQVWFGVKGFTGPSGSYSFAALIGSVLNAGVQYGSPLNTKSLQTSSSYAFPVTPVYATQISPLPSPYSVIGATPAVTASATNAGGVQFLSFRSSGFDNVLQVSSSQLPGLLSNWGSYGESELLWVTGVPVYDQAVNNPVSGTPNLAILGASGVYQVKFTKPIPEPFVKPGNSINNAALELLGKNWTILNYSEPSGAVASNNAIAGGMLSLAASLTSLQTIYVGHNITSGKFSVQLTDLGQPNSAGQSQAAVQVYYNGTLTNVTQLAPGTTTKFTVGGHNVFVNVNQTFAGLYAYQKWAKLKLYSNVLNVTSGSVFNSTNAGGWNAYILWTNGTSSGKANQLQGLLVSNTSSTTLLPGGSFSFVTPNMTAWKVSFLGDTLGTNFDPVQFSTSAQNGLWLQNGALTGVAVPGLANITSLQNQPAQVLSVTSQIPGAFSFSGQPSSSTLMYDLTPYQLAETGNSIGFSAGSTSGLPANIVIQVTNGNANVINPSTPITLTVWGAQSATQTPVPQQVQVYALKGNGGAVPAGVTSAAWNAIALPQNLYNVTNVYMSQPLPGVTANVVATVGTSGLTTTANSFAVYSPQATPQLLYKNANKPYWQQTSGTSATYNQQTGQSFITGGFQLTSSATVPSSSSQQYFQYSVQEYNVPGSTSSNDVLAFGIYNSTTGGAQSFHFQLNQSTTGTRNNMTYISSQFNTVQAPLGFITERGTKLASEGASSVTVNFAKAVDSMQFVVSPSSTSLGNASTTKAVGPVNVGQAVPGFANLTVKSVNASCAFTATSCQVTGLANVTATPSRTQAVVSVSLNTATTPLVVLDGNANSAATLVLVGSKFVNSVSAQVFAQNPSLNSSFGPGQVVVQAYGTNRILVAGYTANQTVQAGNQFINALLQAASAP